MGQPFHNVCIDWDFDAESKARLFAPTIKSEGQPILLPITEETCSFFEILATRPTNVYIKEAFLNTSIKYSDVKTPFLYIRNVGDSPVLVHSSEKEGFWNYSEHQICGINSISGQSFQLGKGEAATISFNASADGTVFSSKVDFGFGVYHEYINVREVNPNGDYPACSRLHENEEIPIFAYQQICGYPTNSTFDQNYSKIRTFNSNVTVDNGVNLELSFSKEGASSISQFQNIISNFGNHRIESNFSTPTARIKDNFSQYCVISDFESQKFCAKITGDYCVKVTYPLNLERRDLLSYKYQYSGQDQDSDQKINLSSNTELSTLSFSGSNQLLANTPYDFQTDKETIPTLEIKSCAGYSIQSLNTKTVSRDNLFLPQFCDFSIPLSLELNNANFGLETGLRGYWGEVTQSPAFANTAAITAANSDISPVCCILSHLSESRANTAVIEQKTKDSRSERFDTFYCAAECSFFYSGIEYKYTPLSHVLFEGNCYPIPNCTIPMCFGVSGNLQCVDFPIQASNESTLKIISNFETIEKNAGANLTLSYSGIEFKKVYGGANDIVFNYPKIRTPDLSGDESPDLKIDFCHKLLIQKNIEFYVNPFGASGYKDYGLNNFFVFLTSQLNSGLASQPQEAHSYKSAGYNFLMMDLQEEFPRLTAPTGDWTLIDQRIVISPASSTTPMAYRSVSGNGYNYILPISTGLNFCDEFTHRDAGQGYSCVQISQPTNFLSTGVRYYGGATTGENCSFVADSTFSIIQNKTSISIPSKSLSETSGNREFWIDKKYTFSGVQPIKIESNYPLLDIKPPIICANLLNFSQDVKDENVNSVYYYTYKLGDFQQKPLRFLAPDCTQIAMITWKDGADDKRIDFTQQSTPLGIIQSNAAQICFLTSSIVNENSCVYSVGDSKININIIGSL